tara:strand:- start:1635 stop:1778 length:144 start_codon:yes stop_codon:yes gene_type:complete
MQGIMDHGYGGARRMAQCDSPSKSSIVFMAVCVPFLGGIVTIITNYY